MGLPKSVRVLAQFILYGDLEKADDLAVEDDLLGLARFTEGLSAVPEFVFSIFGWKRKGGSTAGVVWAITSGGKRRNEELSLLGKP